jgi:hypothetical protein
MYPFLRKPSYAQTAWLRGWKWIIEQEWMGRCEPDATLHDILVEESGGDSLGPDVSLTLML